MYFYNHTGNTLFVDDTLYESMFNKPYNAIFLDFDDLCGLDHYLLGIIILYLESLLLSRYGVFTYVQHNPFGRIKYINCGDPGQF
jgi:chromatin segregation and condensation protein Rec8/ScpA/Scc1 (kleisin family)